MIYFKCPRCGQSYSEEELDKITNMTTEHYSNKCSVISHIKCSKCGYSDFNTYDVYPSDMWATWINYKLTKFE